MTDNNNKNNELLACLINAVKPDFTILPEYVGRIKQKETVTVFSEDGTATEHEVEFFISKESIQGILGLVRQKAGLADDFQIPPKSQSE